MQGCNRILVTGGAGFIGSNLVRQLLNDGKDVVVLDNLSTGVEENLDGCDAEWIHGDVRNSATVERAARGCETIFHLAATVGNTRSLKDPIGDAEVNVFGTVNVLEAARKLGIRKVVYSSSAAIFGEPREMPISTDHPTDPDSPYGVSKLAGEKLCGTYSRVYGLETICLRYFNVYGVNQRYDAYGNVIPIFVERLFQDQDLIIYGDGRQTRDFVNVQDVVRANVLAGKARGVSGVFNIGSGKAVTIREVACLLQSVSGKTVNVRYQAPRAGDVTHSQADIRAAAEVLRYKPAVKLLEGLTEYVAWYEAPNSFIHRSELQLWALPG